MQVLPFILCGGAGTRLWPLSREAYPKQFHRLTGPETLFQLTCRRLTGPLFGELYILSNHRHRFLIAEQLEEIVSSRFTSFWSLWPKYRTRSLYCRTDRRAD